MKPRLFGATLEAMVIRPLEEGPCPVAEWPAFDEHTSLEDANERILELRLGDGLPGVPPTAERLARMLDGVETPGASLGKLAPLHGDVTAEAVAYQAVFAGCRPEWLDVVLAGVRACADPALNLRGLLTTTGTAAVAVILHGEAAIATGANSGGNCLGPGNRANACIGRAIALSLTHIGGAMPGLTDMATMGQPGKYTFCWAELPGSGLLPPLSERRGLAPGAGAVTVVGASGTTEVMLATASTADSIAETVARSMQALGSLSITARWFGGGEPFVLLPAEAAAIFESAGWTLERVQQEIFDRGRFPASELSGPVRRDTVERAGVRTPDEITVAERPQDVQVVLAGGVGAKATLVPTWPGGTRSVTVPV
jgi:hypothetical protein